MFSAEWERALKEGGAEAMRMAERLGLPNPFFVPDEEPYLVRCVELEPYALPENKSPHLDRVWLVKVDEVVIGQLIRFAGPSTTQYSGSFIDHKHHLERKEVPFQVVAGRVGTGRYQYRSLARLVLGHLAQSGLRFSPDLKVCYRRGSKQEWMPI